ncbi:Low conductance mechanosensitive channel YnaI [Aquisphaera giovannonii]|uniref:Low conductance mechanosensitive channel YnaI n=1 Tax=Aquisphaera giovannonii TaxID=406548 RepID=A0A5B9W4C1_9BACT|nr:mechanosensitive ion channel family protein [Aquisphaera giovannonii]QEH34830.1 Low conductance mechanosensitive channel YnaI [Aquisphaera giovannonii]
MHHVKPHGDRGARARMLPALLGAWLLAGSAPTTGQEPRHAVAATGATVTPGGEGSVAASKAARPGRSPGEIARWNDRSTPRKMLETFFFAIYCYDLAPELIVNAIDCLDLKGLGQDVGEADAALMAHELSSIVSRQDVALYGVPDTRESSIATWTLVEKPGYHLALGRQADGRWRFDRETVLRIPSMRSEVARQQREVQAARMKMADGRTDPEATMRKFLVEVTLRDFSEAARCLDLRDVPIKLRATRGPEMARKLAFVIQRCGFFFPQEVVSDPDGWRYIWHSNHRGRIMLDRIRQPDGRDAWLFNRGTLHNLDALVEGFRDAPPDPRYAFLGVVVDAASLKAGERDAVPAPGGVPAHLASPRAALRTFLEGMDELDFDDARTGRILSCMALGEVPEADRASVGLRVAGKLDAVVQHLNPDLLSVSDSWDAEPQAFGKGSDFQVVISRQADGRWQFEPDTIARVPELFDRLSPQEKRRKDRESRFGSARQTLRTFLRAVARGDDETAAAALDLGAVPVRARSAIGPVLARKLKFVLDRTGPLHVQESPNEAEGPRYVYYRGPLGQISLEAAGEARKGDWLFTAETVSQVEPMFLAAISRKAAPARDPVTRASLGILARGAVPGWLQAPVLGLGLYQWIGLALVVPAAGAAGWLALRAFEACLRGAIRRSGFRLGDEFLRAKLRPLGWQLGLFLAAVLLEPLDLPVAAWGRALPVLKFAWIGLMAWTAIRLVDLGMALYANSDQLQHRRNLSDMVVPTGARFLKLAVLVVAASCEVYLVGNGEWVTRLLAGLGLVGLAASLAAQDTLKNFFGTLLLIGEHPFKIGDSIVVGGMEGTVESVGFRSTWIRTPDDSLITIPNSIIANASIDNRGARTTRRYKAVIGVDYDTPAHRLNALREALRAYAAAQPSILKDRVDIYVHALGGTAVELLVNVYFAVRSHAEEVEARDAFNREVLDQARRLDIRLAPERRTALVAHEPASPAAIPAPMGGLTRRVSDPEAAAEGARRRFDP